MGQARRAGVTSSENRRLSHPSSPAARFEPRKAHGMLRFNARSSQTVSVLLVGRTDKPEDHTRGGPQRSDGRSAALGGQTRSPRSSPERTAAASASHAAVWASPGHNCKLGGALTGKFWLGAVMTSVKPLFVASDGNFIFLVTRCSDSFTSIEAQKERREIFRGI